MPWTNPGASQSLPGSRVREASLSTADSSPQPASLSLWKVSFNHRVGGGRGSGGGGEGGIEETVRLEGRGVIRHYCPSPMLAGHNASALDMGVRDGREGKREEMETEAG